MHLINVNKRTSVLFIKELICKINCGINDNGIKDLNLVELYAHHNEKIANVIKKY